MRALILPRRDLFAHVGVRGFAELKKLVRTGIPPDMRGKVRPSRVTHPPRCCQSLAQLSPDCHRKLDCFSCVLRSGLRAGLDHAGGRAVAARVGAARLLPNGDR